MTRKLTKYIRFLADHKIYIEIITALLTIPVLITVIYLNFSNITGKNKPPEETGNRPIIIENKISPPPEQPQSDEGPPPNQEVCKKEIGPISISFPKEGATISDNPMNFIIKYEDTSYCSVVWSYRINNGSWSEYGSNSPTIYSLPSGKVKFELRIKSTVSEDEDLLERNFTYDGQQTTPEPSPNI